jgi:hypothetical protein
MNQALEMQADDQAIDPKEEDPMLQFKYDLSKLSQFNKYE